ncbi:UNVERIFIED_CONTAM: hypothetical protein Slati_2960600 [Sesamum latifolium]|uniref:Uncharacterized protein n=1 Tax=Sesamum latifolium TaxID=2727402 RepID=A0AAW2VF96_9LAMI
MMSAEKYANNKSRLNINKGRRSQNKQNDNTKMLIQRLYMRAQAEMPQQTLVDQSPTVIRVFIRIFIKEAREASLSPTDIGGGVSSIQRSGKPQGQEDKTKKNPLFHFLGALGAGRKDTPGEGSEGRTPGSRLQTKTLGEGLSRHRMTIKTKNHEKTG